MTDFIASCVGVVRDPVFLQGLICGVSFFLVPKVVVYLTKGRYHSKTSKQRSGGGDENDDEEEESDSDDYEDEESSDELEDSAPKGEEVKLMLVVRTDLQMGKGKAAAQCAHAAVGAYKQASVRAKNLLQVWCRHGQAKVVVKVETEAQLLALAEEAKNRRLITCLISDAGRTQIQSGSRTVLAIGPAPQSELTPLTGHLKLY